MARLEFIDFQPWRVASFDPDSDLELDPLRKSVKDLPQIYWNSGSDWAEVNLWALQKSVDDTRKCETVLSLMRHMKAYADYLEGAELDWRHFPVAKESSTVFNFRGALIAQIKNGDLASSTASARMAAVIQFYRYAESNGFLGRAGEMWRDKDVVVSWYDTAGFKHAVKRTSSELTIPNRGKTGSELEDGLLPLSADAMKRLLNFTEQKQTEECLLLLSIGFFTGARIGTINGLRREHLFQARPDPLVKDIYLLPVGPKAGVPTKFDVNGHLMVPLALLNDLKKYVESEIRLLRQIKAVPKDKSLIFLTRRGNPYSVKTVDRLTESLRDKALLEGLEFMAGFKFHQTRATYGTSLMQSALDVMRPSAAIDLTRRAMLHAHESTTFRYIKFIQDAKVKAKLANEYTRIFGDLGNSSRRG